MSVSSVRSFVVRLGAAAWLAALTAHAAPVSSQTAQEVARTWLERISGTTYHVRPSAHPARSALGASALSASSHPAYHVVQMQEGGWVIVAGDDRMRPILGYGFSRLDPARMPSNARAWLRGLSKALRTPAAQTKLGASTATTPGRDPRWDHLGASTDTGTTHVRAPLGTYGSAPTMVVEPLLWMGGSGEGDGLQWDQVTIVHDEEDNQTYKYDTYNAQTPIADSRKGDGHMLTGCVATAMGQVLYYYYHERGRDIEAHGSYSYVSSSHIKATKSDDYFQYDLGLVSADFGGYDWGNMPLSLDESSPQYEVDAVAKLLYHLGVSVEMNYGYGEGTADTGGSDGGSLANYCTLRRQADGACMDVEREAPSAYAALKQYFGFTDVVWALKSDYAQQWDDMLHHSLNNAHPILYGGSGNMGGHAFVLDGYATQGYYHVNWGFGGQANGWYLLDTLAPEGTNMDFSEDNQAIFFGGVVSGYIAQHQSQIVRHDDDMTFGGGCTYNPRHQGIDAVMMLMVLLSMAYPFGRRYLRGHE